MDGAYICRENKRAFFHKISDPGDQVKDQWKYLYRAVDKEQLCTATLGFKSFKSAKITIGGIELMRIIQKRQIRAEGNSFAGIFYSMAA
jgi:transposase-like protein